VKFTDYPDSQRAVAVSMFDARFGEMEQVLWCLSVNSRAGLLVGESSPVLEALVWTIKSWWGVQGFRSETKAQMARALAESMTWSPDLFGPVPEYGPDCAEYACERVAELVSRSMSLGVPRLSTRWPPRSCTGSCPGGCPSTTASSAAHSASRRHGITPRHTARSRRRFSRWPAR